MRIVTYEYRDINPSGWQFSPVQLKRVNLLVGPTGSGKSRFENSIFNVSQFAHNGTPFREGKWDITLKIEQGTYRWQFHAMGNESDTAHILFESLHRIEGQVEAEIFKRSPTQFTFNGKELPRLSRNTPGLFLLREEDVIAPIHRAFGLILRRSFWGPDLQHACAIANLPNGLIEQVRQKGKADSGLKQTLLTIPLGLRLFVLRDTDRPKFNDVVEQFRSVFPSIESFDFRDGSNIEGAPANGKIPILVVKERGVAHPIPLHELSSGMQKVLLIISDVLTMEKGTVYLIDEYENSLGINAVNFLPGFLSEFGEDAQFLITSHHPYLINSTPITNWSVFRRRGSMVTVEAGDELAKKYGPSKQDAFVQLLNDPEFSGQKV